MNALLIGTLRLTRALRDDADPHGGHDPAWLPQLFVAGLPFPRFAAAMVARARAHGRTWPDGVVPRPEDSYFRLHPDERLSRAEPVVVACCPCGVPECGSTCARVQTAELSGVPGLLLSGWHTRLNPGRDLPVGAVFIPFEAWPAPVRGPFIQELLDVPDAARATWAAQAPWMLAAAREAAASVRDPWGRSLGARHWDRVARAESRANLAAIRQPERPDVTLQRTLSRLDTLARRVRLDAPADLERQLAALDAQRVEAQRTHDTQVHLDGLGRRDRRVTRRAALRAQFGTRTQAEARAAQDEADARARARVRAALGL